MRLRLSLSTFFVLGTLATAPMGCSASFSASAGSGAPGAKPLARNDAASNGRRSHEPQKTSDRSAQVDDPASDKRPGHDKKPPHHKNPPHDTDSGDDGKATDGHANGGTDCVPGKAKGHTKDKAKGEAKGHDKPPCSDGPGPVGPGSAHGGKHGKSAQK